MDRVGVVREDPERECWDNFVPEEFFNRRAELYFQIMSSNAENYRIAKEAQDVFREVIKCCMEGNVVELAKQLDQFLAKNKTYTAEEFFTGFQSEGKTLLHIAASGGHFPVFEYIVGKCKDPKQYINRKDDKGFTPIINATISESNQIMETLIKLGSDVNLRNNDGAAAIHFAAGDGSVERMSILCQAGAQLDHVSHSGTPLHWAAGKARSDAIKFLISKIQEFDSEKAKKMINHVSREGMPAVLMAAVASCDLGVSYLVEAGADIGLIVTGNLTTLHICAEHGLATAVASIVHTSNGHSSCRVLTTEGNAPIHLAAMAKDREVVKILIPHSDLTFLNNRATADETVFTDKAMPVTEALVDEILADGAQRLIHWEEQHKLKSEQSEAENNEFTKISTTAESSSAVTADNEAAAETFKETGNALFKQGKFQAAIDAYTEALYLNKFNATYWSNRSAAYMGLQEFTKAVKDAEICRQLKPDWPRGCYRLAVARLALNQFEDAAVAAFEGVKLDEKNKELKELLQRAVKLGQEEHKKSIAAKS